MKGSNWWKTQFFVSLKAYEEALSNPTVSERSLQNLEDRLHSNKLFVPLHFRHFITEAIIRAENRNGNRI